MKDWHSWLEIFVLLSVLISLAIPLGTYIAKVYQGQVLWIDKIVHPIEFTFYKISGINFLEQMTWKSYAQSVVSLGFVSFLLLYALLRLQYYLPLNPQHYLGVQPDLAFNMAISFLTNTNWQSYEGEKVLSYFSQMMGLSVQNFISAGTGMAVAVALVRGFSQSGGLSLGNFWVDLTRGVFYILLPLSIIMSILLISQGVIQNFNDYLTLPSIELSASPQVIPGGPVASQVSIKQLGSNGGGFFSANSAHPFENPTPFSNFLELLAILLIPVSFIVAYGRMVGQPRQSRALLGLLFCIFMIGFLFCAYQEVNYEGKEYRHGILNSVLWTVASTATSNGSSNALIESFTPLTEMSALLFMLTGEVVFGGVGQGLYSLILYILITVFVAGLMSGRMPEYLGKKIEVFEIKMSLLAILIPALSILFFVSVAVQLSMAHQSSLTEWLYHFASTTSNNGSALSALSALNANTSCLNTLFGLTMLLGRYGVIIPVLAISGSLILKRKKKEESKVVQNRSVIETDSIVFMILVFGVIGIISLLSFFPAILMGPIADYLSGVKN